MNRGLRIGSGSKLGGLGAFGIKGGGVSDVVRPSVVITSSESSPSFAATIPLTITFSESVTGFVVGDITVVGCTLAGFAGSGTTYTVNATATASAVTVDIAQNVCVDGAGNGNTAASQFAITSLFYGLVIALNMEETSGNRADATGRGNTATETGTVTFDTGIVSNAAKSAAWGLNYLTVAYGTDLALGDVDWSLSVWIYPSAITGYPTFLSQAAAGPAIDWNLWIDSDVNRFKFSAGASSAISALTVSANNWYNVWIGYKAATDKIQISVNGETLVEATKTGGITDNSHDLLIGRPPFVGSGAANNTRIDRVYRWSRLLSDAERTLDYGSGTPKQVP